jgi:leader peptidase (prepilin peptidase)/N-methyltransferase
MAVPSLLVIAATVFGAAAGAFLPCPADRLAVPFGSPPRPACATCARPFPPGPTGFLRVGPPCPCRPRQWLAAALTTAAATALLATTLGATPLLPLLLLAAVPATLLAMIDIRCLRLPDPLMATLAALIIVPLTLSGAPPRAFLAAAVVGLAYLLLALLPGDGLGLGDVKLAAVLAFVLGYIGWPAVAIGIVVPHVINGPIAVISLLRRTRRRAIPFGPSLLLGTLAAITLTA